MSGDISSDAAATAPGSRPRERYLRYAVAAAATAAAVGGWKLFWFLTDDAYIFFRYAANSMAGQGLVWNPAPFRAVEGYTSFLWVVLLKLVWQVTGVEPPSSSTVLSLAFGIGTLALTCRFVAGMSLPPAFARHRTGLLALVLLGTVANRTFLAWLSSGLETALFNFFLTWWVYESFAAAGRRGASWVLRLSLAAAFAALARPDGMLAVLGTLAILGCEAAREGSPGLPRLRWALPLLAVPAHLAWRRLTYGGWLPNTYYAKYLGPWPESGLRYLGCFVLEYGVWVWLALAAAWLVRNLRAGLPAARAGALERAAPAIGAAALGAHAAYYTLVIGGDHFEFRVFSHLIPLLFVSGAWLAARLSRRAATGHLALVLFVLASLPIPWVHWAQTRGLTRRAETFVLVRPIAHLFPGPLRPPVALWDRWQAWLIPRHVGMRHQEHKVFHQSQLEVMPPREFGLAISWEQKRPVLVLHSVGVAGWALPNLAIIDLLGLNDRVIARTPVRTAKEHWRMAHGRKPPPGYTECFRPNAALGTQPSFLAIETRREPLTDAQIRACEERDWPAAP